MQAFWPLVAVVWLVLSYTLAYIFSRGYEKKGAEEGFRFGLYVGVIFALLSVAWYTVLPVSEELAKAWAVAAVIEGIGLGLVFSETYKPGKK